MITFDDIKQEPKKTLYFFNASFADRIAYFLNKAGITDYKILKHNNMRKSLPATITIPNVYNSLVEGRLRPATAVLISHFNLTELHKKMWEIYDSDDAHTYATMISEQALEKTKDTINYTDEKILVCGDKK